MKATALKPIAAYIILAALLAVFITLKWEQLLLPHYWDEAWSYATAVHEMYNAGPSLLPGNVDPEFTRGHPLLFYFLASGWMKLWGASIISKHLFALSISLAMIWSLFVIGNRLWNNVWLSLGFSALWMVQSIFFVQSSMLLPEVLVAFLTIISLYLFATERWWGLSLALILLVLTKESGLVIWGGIGLTGLIISIIRQSFSYFKQVFISLLFPFLIIVAFFIYQYATYGWMFFPGHIGLMQLNKSYIGNILTDIFAFKGHYVLIIALALLSVLLYFKNKHMQQLLLGCVPLVLLALALLKPLMGVFFNIFIIIAFILIHAIILIGILKSRINVSKPLNVFVFTTIIVSSAYIAFCAVNFFTPRYLMPYSVLLCFLVIFQCVKLSQYYTATTARMAIYGLPFIASIILLISTQHQKSDVSLGAYNALKVQKDLIDYMQENVDTSNNISWGSYQMSINLSNTACGFIKDTIQVYTNTQYDILPKTDYILFDNIEPDNREDHIINNPIFKLVFETHHGRQYGKIFKRISY